MSTPDSRGLSRLVGRSGRRKKALNVDLNVPPPLESTDNVGPSVATVSQNVQVGQSGGSTHAALIDLEALDDVVVISSPSAFHAAKNNSRGIRARPVVVDVDLDSEDRSTRSSTNNLIKRRRAPPIIDCEAYVGRETETRVERVAPPPPPPPPPPEPTFSCPICMGPLVEEMSTKCGHIFCKNCIKASIAAQNKCPTCRRKVTIKDIIRIYLPTTK